VNLKMLSEVLGLSQTTVSRALNGYPEVSEKTRKRVEQAAREHNYSPNRGASTLATGRSMTIGHVLSEATSNELVNPIFGDFIAGASEIYKANKYDMLFSLVKNEEEADIYNSLLRRGVVDGVVLQAPKISDERIKMLENLGIPFVVHGRSSKSDASYSWVDVNNRSAFRRATEFLLDLGHRRIALINGLTSLDFAQRRYFGYCEALKSRGVEIDSNLVTGSEMTEVYGYMVAKEMLLQRSPPTAILTASMISAIGVRRAVQELGLTLGKQVSIVTHDDELSYLNNGQQIPIFTATRSSVRKAGRIAAQMLIDRIESPNAPKAEVLLEAELVLGASTGPAPL
jgi:LacI family transcriptional regulator